MKNLLFVSVLCLSFFACSDDQEDNNKYCWELIYNDSKIAPCGFGSGVADELCDKTEKEMQQIVNDINIDSRKLYNDGTERCLREFTYKKSVK